MIELRFATSTQRRTEVQLTSSTALLATPLPLRMVCMSPPESFQSSALAFQSDAARVGSPTGPNGHARAAAYALLDAACGAAARKDWSADPLYAGPGPSAESAALRTAAMAFVLARKEELRPEQVIVELKTTLNSLLLKHGYWRDQRAVRSIVFAAFLASYYDDVQYR